MAILKRKKTSKKEEVAKTQEKATKPAAKKEKAPAAKGLNVQSGSVIIKPLITEKTATIADTNKYTFVVKKAANRVQVKQDVKQMYGVSPISVNIMNVRGKKVRFGRRVGKRTDWKKAVVTLPEGQTINVYEGV